MNLHIIPGDMNSNDDVGVVKLMKSAFNCLVRRCSCLLPDYFCKSSAVECYNPFLDMVTENVPAKSQQDLKACQIQRIGDYDIFSIRSFPFFQNQALLLRKSSTQSTGSDYPFINLNIYGPCDGLTSGVCLPMTLVAKGDTVYFVPVMQLHNMKKGLKLNSIEFPRIVEKLVNTCDMMTREVFCGITAKTFPSLVPPDPVLIHFRRTQSPFDVMNIWKSFHSSIIPLSVGFMREKHRIYTGNVKNRHFCKSSKAKGIQIVQAGTKISLSIRRFI